MFACVSLSAERYTADISLITKRDILSCVNWLCFSMLPQRTILTKMCSLITNTGLQLTSAIHLQCNTKTRTDPQKHTLHIRLRAIKTIKTNLTDTHTIQLPFSLTMTIGIEVKLTRKWGLICIKYVQADGVSLEWKNELCKLESERCRRKALLPKPIRQHGVCLLPGYFLPLPLLSTSPPPHTPFSPPPLGHPLCCQPSPHCSA